MMKIRLANFGFLLGGITTGLLLLSASVGAEEPTDIILKGIRVREEFKLTIQVEAYGLNDDDDCIFAIPGFQETAPTWQPLADALPPESCLLAINMPGRQRSGLPNGLIFGDLTLEDYTTIVLNTLHRLHDRLDIDIERIIGHSMGGLLIQMAQERLASTGTDLAERFGINDAIFLASGLPAEVPLANPAGGQALLDAFGMEDKDRGLIVAIPAEAVPGLFFADLEGEVVSNALTAQQLIAMGFVAPNEPRIIAAQIFGIEGQTRPSISAGVFGDAVRLQVLAYEQDPVVTVQEGRQLYAYLTGDKRFACFKEITGPDTPHNLHMSDPEAIIGALAALEECSIDDRSDNDDDD